MRIDLALGLLLAATAMGGVAAGATLDQTIKQLPARHAIGVLAYTAYSQAADLRNGRRWYIPLGVVWTLLLAASVLAGWVDHASGHRAAALDVMGAGVVAHLLITGLVAIPTLGAQPQVARDEAALERLFDRFARWNLLRAVTDTATLAATVWALAATIATPAMT